MKNDFSPFKIGTVFNRINGSVRNNYPVLECVEILFPTRLNAMAIDPSKIAENNNLVYTAGEIVFSIKIYRRVVVKVTKSGCRIDKNCRRKPLIKHAFEIMKKAIGFKNGFYIKVSEEYKKNHIGLGSSSNLISGVATAINEIYGNPIKREDLVQYLAQNHGEEIAGKKDYLNPVQCLGGSAASGLFEGGVLVVAGESRVIKRSYIDPSYKIVIGVPKDFKPIDSKKALKKELENIHGFVDCGKKYGPNIAYNVLHKFLPAMEEGDLKAMGDVIYDYRFRMGSIKNCSFLYPQILKLTSDLAFLKKKGLVDVLSISSVGPLIFAITKNPKKCLEHFNKRGLSAKIVEIENGKYLVVKKITKEEKFWDEHADFFSIKNVSEYVKKHLSRIKEKKKKSLLDIGCGGGRNITYATKEGFNAYGLDKSKRMVSLTQKKIEGITPKKGERKVVNSNMLRIPYPRESFDVVLAIGVIHQAKSKRELEIALKEAYRVLKKRGIMIAEIFTSKYIAKDLNNLGEGVYVTKEGLYMTLLTKKEFLELCRKYGLKTEVKPIEEIIDVGTGLRSILRVVLKKIKN